MQCVWSSSAQRHSLVTGRLHETLRSRSTSRQRQNTGLTDIVIIITHQIILQTQMALTSPFPHFSLPFSLLFFLPCLLSNPIFVSPFLISSPILPLLSSFPTTSHFSPFPFHPHSFASFFVCLPARLSQKLYLPILRNLMYMAAARSIFRSRGFCG